MASRKSTEFVTLASLDDADFITAIDDSQPSGSTDSNAKITKANLHAGLATDTDVATVQGNLDTHEATGAGTAHPDGTTLTDLNNHKAAANQHTIAGVTGLQTALDAKEDTVNLGNAAYRDVGTLAGDVAAGDAPVAAVTAHDGDAGAHGGNIPTTAQKAALDGNAALGGANPVAGQDDIVDEGIDLKSTAVAASKILESDGVGGFTYIDTPTPGGAATDLTSAPDADSVLITSSTGTDADILAAVPSGNAGVLTGADAQKLADQPDSQVTSPEKTAGTELALRTFSPKDVADMAGVHGGGGGGVTDHGALTGLADDDHTQYHNDARGDARYDSLGSAASVQGNLDTHTGTVTGNPHGVTQGDVGLGNVDNTSDLSKPISTATQTALDAKLPITGGELANYGEADNNLGNVAGTANLDTGDGMVQYGTMTGDTTFSLVNNTGHNATSISFLMASGGFSATFSGVTWAGATPDLSANGTYLLAFFLISATWYGVLAA